MTVEAGRERRLDQASSGMTPRLLNATRKEASLTPRFALRETLISARRWIVQGWSGNVTVERHTVTLFR
jgi:hypothetical protein